MKKKTLSSKKDKATLIAAEKAAIEQLKKDFKEMRKEKDYSTLGNSFFHIFITEDKKTLYRKTAEKLWDSLTEEEQMMCEEC